MRQLATAPSVLRPRLCAALAAAAALAVTSAPALAEVRVTATIKPIHALVAQVMDGVGEPALLVKGAASPHTYAMKPSDAKAVNGADVVFRVSEAVEPFTRKIVAALPEKVRVVTLAEAPGVEWLAIRTGETFEVHDHDHAHGHGAETHEHGAPDHADHGHGEAGHDHAEEETSRDGHVWLDPENARKMIAEIARVLSEADPPNADRYKANAARADAALAALQEDIARDLAPVKDKPYVVFHDAYQYFERRFGLSAVGSITINPDAKPSAKRLTEIRKKLSALSASCVFSEPQVQSRLVATVTEGTSARPGMLDPEGALVEPGPKAYETLLRNLASGLKTCLVQGS